MRILGIETSTARSSVALLVDGAVAAHEAHEDARGHGAFLAPAVHRCLDATGGHVDAVAVGTGPGLYTGLRVGLATATAFASARGLPAVGVAGMDALALGCGITDRTVVTVLDARRGQVFWAVHRPDAAGRPAVALVRSDGPRVGTRAELDAEVARLAADGSVAVVGEVVADEVLRPDAADTARLGARMLDDGMDGAARSATLTPVYLREADVRIGWDERGGVRGGVERSAAGGAA